MKKLITILLSFLKHSTRQTQIPRLLGLILSMFLLLSGELFAADFGDAPASYGTPSHTAAGSLKLGVNAPDNEVAAQPNATATGDDVTGTDDEDGISVFSNLYAAGTSYFIPTANISATGTGTLHAWIDFDKNGAFTAAEYQSVAVTSGTLAGPLNWTGVTVGSAGTTYARFRFTSTVLTDNTSTTAVDERATMAAVDGEIEDYAVTVQAVTSSSGGSCQVLPGPFISLAASNFTMPGQANYAGYPNSTASLVNSGATSLASPDSGNSALWSEETLAGNGGVVDGNFVNELIITPSAGSNSNIAGVALWALAISPPAGDGPLREFTLKVTHSGGVWTSPSYFTAKPTAVGAPNSGQFFAFGQTFNDVTEIRLTTLNGWYNQNTSWPSGQGSSWIPTTSAIWTSGTSTNQTYNMSLSEFRLVSPGSTDPSSCDIDFSDSPASYGAPNHIIVAGQRLGASVDAELAANFSVSATGDDVTGTDDEDGISAFLTLTAGSGSYSIPAANISATGSGTLHAWIDFDKNGAFTAAEYQSVAVTSGTLAGPLSWTGITVGSAGTTYARFRFTSTALTDNTSTTAVDERATMAAANGEVEDYAVTIHPIGVITPVPPTTCGNLLTAEFDGSFGTLASGTRNLQTPPGSGYTYTGDLMASGRYTVVSKVDSPTIHVVHWRNIIGVNTGTADDAYLAVNGSTAVGVFYKQTIALQANRGYRISLFAINAVSGSDASGDPELGIRLIQESTGTVVATTTTGIIQEKYPTVYGGYQGPQDWTQGTIDLMTPATDNYRLEVFNI